jgi:hypothetical protein
MVNFRNFFKPGSKYQVVQRDIPQPTRSDKIHAFHSILAMLAQIQQDDHPLKTEDVMAAKPPSASERKQLKLSNAFAHLAVTDHEVVAATLYAPEGLAVMTWMQDEEPDGHDKPEAAQGTPKAKFWEKMLWVFTTNTRSTDHEPNSAYRKECPRVVGATPPPGYPTADDPKTNLDVYLREFPKNW